MGGKSARVTPIWNSPLCRNFSTLSSPPCISSQMETLALACLALIPTTSSVSPSYSTLSHFLSHRSGLSNQSIPLVMALVRHLLPSTTSKEDLQALGGVLGLISST